MARKAKIYSSMSKRVKARDNYICRACGFGGSEEFAPFLTCDHIKAESNGGKTSDKNLQALCHHCNACKGANNWEFAVRTEAVPQSVWAHNHKVIKSAFITDVDKRLKKLK